MIYLKISKNFKSFWVLIFVLFLFIVFLLYFWGCGIGYRDIYYTVFDVEKNYGYLIPISFKLNRKTQEQVLTDMVYNILKVNVSKINKQDKNNDINDIKIYLQSKPDLSYDYDILLAYERLYFSFFYSKMYGNIYFYFNGNDLVLGGIDFNFKVDKINIKVFNDIFNLGDIRKGGYFLFSSVDKDKVIPIFLPNNYTLDVVLSNNFNNKGLYSLKDYLIKKLGAVDVSLESSDSLVIYLTQVKVIPEKFYFLFFNSNLNEVILKGKKTITLNRPKDFSFIYYPINEYN